MAPQTEERAPVFQWVDSGKLVRRKPFSTLLPIRDETYGSIKASILAKGFDPAHPVHVWDRDGTLTLVDGHTRDKAAGEAGLTRLPAFIHHFKDETEALGFAIECQIERRNITGGELFALVGVYDEKVKPSSTQQRQQDGTFAPRASTDADGKSAGKTAEKLKTTATNVERVRYLHKYADAATKAKVTNNKLTISGACEVVKKQLAAKTAETEPDPKADTENNDSSPFGLTLESDVAFATWEPVVRHESALSADIEDGADAEPEVGYVLAEELLDVSADTKGLGTPRNHRVLVAPGLDLFDDEVPAKIIRPVLKSAAEAKRFDFLFTTRNPARLQEFPWEGNAFAGVSIFEQKDVAPAEGALLELDGPNKWLVVEQLTMELTFAHLNQLDWLVVREGAGVLGAGNDPHAMKSLLRQAWAAGCPVLFERGVAYHPTDPPKAPQAATETGEGSADE